MKKGGNRDKHRCHNMHSPGMPLSDLAFAEMDNFAYATIALPPVRQQTKSY